MHAIILAAGQGKRLSEFNPEGLPKCMLEFGGRSLLERQLEILFNQGVRHVTLVVGYKAGLIVDYVGTLSVRPEVAFVYNPAFDRGSVISLLAAHETLTSGENLLVLNADVLFHPKIMQRLMDSPHTNCCLVDTDSFLADDSVKIAIGDGRVVELRASISERLAYDTLGMSLGFFRLDGDRASQIAGICREYESEGLLGAPHEEALRDVLKAQPSAFEYEDVGGLPWVGLDFPEDVERAIKQVLPRIEKDPAGS